MDNILGSEWIVFISMMVHLLLAPGTKVEESFNVQATHDLIYEGFNISNYDHHVFPGVVPRTFAGPLSLAAFGIPMRAIFWMFGIQKIWMLFFVRFVLGSCVVIAFLNFVRCVRKHFGEETALFLRLITASQFHLLFYSTRPLPNVFALVGVLLVFQKWMDGHVQSAVRWATTFTFLFRCDLVLLFAPVFLIEMVTGRLPLMGRNGAIFNGITAAAKVLAVTVPIDSFFWGRLLWPEGEVAWFNIILNKSHEYGVLPFWWYFYSVLPRALLFSLFLLPVGMLLDRRLKSVVLPIGAYIFFYSFLPHKELRFIMFAFPILNLPAAVVCARMWISRDKGWLRWVVAYLTVFHIFANLLASCTFLYASARNYPGNDALAYLQYMQRMDAQKPRSIHMDVMTCQTGVSRFLHLYDSWEYNKTENLQVPDLLRFDFLSVGSPDGKLRELIEENYSSTHRVMFVVPSFNGIRWRKKVFPFMAIPMYYPELKFKEKIAMLRKREQ